MRIVATALTLCLLPLSAASALEASPAESSWCAELRQNLATRQATLDAEQPELKAGMARAFAQLESDVDVVADRDPDLKQRVLDMKSKADDLANWWEFRRFYAEAGQRLQSLGKGIPAWDIDIVDSLGRKVGPHESLLHEVSDDELVYKASCIDPPRSATASSIVDALRARGLKQPEVLLYMNLAREFRTTSSWALAVVVEKVPRDPEMYGSGPIFICFLRGMSPACLDGTGKPIKVDETDDRIPFELFDARVVHAGADGESPRLLLKTCTEPSGDGDCGIYTTLYAYNRTADRFDSMFRNVTAHNGNELTRFEEGGPIRGDIIVTEPTNNAPYTYWVEVYRPQGGQYARILRYRGKTEYGDGNRLAVADSEMPELLRRLGLWKDGDPLPVPAKMPATCTTLFMRKGVEWCK